MSNRPARTRAKDVGQYTEALESRVAAALDKAGYTGTGTLLVVGVSGGPDSMALLHCLIRLAVLRDFRLHVAHLNHNFREEAEEDARFVASAASELGIPSSIGKADPTAYQKDMGLSSFEEAAREVRYGYLAGIVSETGAQAVALGHTEDDLAESVLMNIIRGSGVNGLRGMAEISTWRDRGGIRSIALFRPLLEVTKQQTTDYCQTLGIAFRTDPANRLLRFTRNRLRHQVLPELTTYNPRVRQALARLSRTAALETDFIEREVDKLWPDLAREDGDTISLHAGSLASLHPFMQRTVLRRAYRQLVGDLRRLREANVSAMVELITGPAGKRLALPRGLWLHRGYREIVLSRSAEVWCPFPLLEGVSDLALAHSREGSVTEIPGWSVSTCLVDSSETMSDDPYEAFFDSTALGETAQVRAREPGDRFQPIGMPAAKKLQDFYVDEKVPRAWRDRVPLLLTERGIAWVVGYRTAEWARAHLDHNHGEDVLRIKFSLNGEPII